MRHKRADVQLTPGHNAYLVAAHGKCVLVCSRVTLVEEEPEQFGTVLTLFTVRPVMQAALCAKEQGTTHLRLHMVFVGPFGSGPG